VKILITGANGFLGQHLTVYLSGKGYDVIACNRGECRISPQNSLQYYSLDITDANAVAATLAATQPDVIIHAAAMSKPDECDNNKEACYLNNVVATKFLTDACLGFQRQFIYVSSDFIFGENGPHGEDDDATPLNYYGETKLQSERIVIQSRLLYTIIRPVFIYGPVLQNMRLSFLHWVKNNLEQQKKIKVVSDQQRTPTFVLDICKSIEKIIKNKHEGVYNIAGKDLLSPYQMAVTVADFLNLDTRLIECVTSDTFKEPVQRAKRSGLKIEKARKILGYEPVSFKEGVQLTFNYHDYAYSA
jgi:dTDP-4-dehydrorhamnose reductase